MVSFLSWRIAWPHVATAKATSSLPDLLSDTSGGPKEENSINCTTAFSCPWGASQTARTAAHSLTLHHMYTTPLNSAQWNGVSVFCCDKHSGGARVARGGAVLLIGALAVLWRASPGVRLGHVKNITSNRERGCGGEMRKQLWQTRCTIGCSWVSTVVRCEHGQPTPPHTPLLHSPITLPQPHNNTSLSYTGWVGTHIDWTHHAPFTHIDTMPLTNRSLTQSMPQSCLSYWHKDQFKTDYIHHPTTLCSPWVDPEATHSGVTLQSSATVTLGRGTPWGQL